MSALKLMKFQCCVIGVISLLLVVSLVVSQPTGGGGSYENLSPSDFHEGTSGKRPGIKRMLSSFFERKEGKTKYEKLENEATDIKASLAKTKKSVRNSLEELTKKFDEFRNAENTHKDCLTIQKRVTTALEEIGKAEEEFDSVLTSHTKEIAGLVPVIASDANEGRELGYEINIFTETVRRLRYLKGRKKILESLLQSKMAESKMTESKKALKEKDKLVSNLQKLMERQAETYLKQFKLYGKLRETQSRQKGLLNREAYQQAGDSLNEPAPQPRESQEDEDLNTDMKSRQEAILDYIALKPPGATNTGDGGSRRGSPRVYSAYTPSDSFYENDFVEEVIWDRYSALNARPENEKWKVIEATEREIEAQDEFDKTLLNFMDVLKTMAEKALPPEYILKTPEPLFIEGEIKIKVYEAIIQKIQSKEDEVSQDFWTLYEILDEAARLREEIVSHSMSVIINEDVLTILEERTAFIDKIRNEMKQKETLQQEEFDLTGMDFENELTQAKISELYKKYGNFARDLQLHYTKQFHKVECLKSIKRIDRIVEILMSHLQVLQCNKELSDSSKNYLAAKRTSQLMVNTYFLNLEEKVHKLLEVTFSVGLTPRLLVFSKLSGIRKPAEPPTELTPAKNAEVDYKRFSKGLELYAESGRKAFAIFPHINPEPLFEQGVAITGRSSQIGQGVSGLHISNWCSDISANVVWKNLRGIYVNNGIIKTLTLITDKDTKDFWFDEELNWFVDGLVKTVLKKNPNYTDEEIEQRMHTFAGHLMRALAVPMCYIRQKVYHLSQKDDNIIIASKEGTEESLLTKHRKLQDEILALMHNVDEVFHEINRKVACGLVALENGF